MVFNSLLVVIIYFAAGSIAISLCIRFFIVILRSLMESSKADSDPDDKFEVREEWKEFM